MFETNDERWARKSFAPILMQLTFVSMEKWTLWRYWDCIHEINPPSMIGVWNNNNCFEKEMQNDSPYSATRWCRCICLTWALYRKSYTKIICDQVQITKKKERRERKRFARLWNSHEQCDWDWIWFSAILACARWVKCREFWPSRPFCIHVLYTFVYFLVGVLARNLQSVATLPNKSDVKFRCKESFFAKDNSRHVY